MEILRWQVGDATDFRIGEVDAMPAFRAHSRSDLIERFAYSDTLIIGGHFADPVAGHIRRDGTGFRLVSTETSQLGRWSEDVVNCR